MAFIVKKKIGGKEYYYLRESKRVGGKVKAITIAYLGKSRREAEEKATQIKENKKALKTKDLQVGVVRGANISEVLSRKFNIYAGISIDNKWFSKENIRKYILWGLKYTKKRFGIVVADTLQRINYQYRDKYTKHGALNKSLKKGDEFVKSIQKIILELPKGDKERIDIIRWEDVKNNNYYENIDFFIEEFNKNKEFREIIKKIVRDFTHRLNRKIKDSQVDSLSLYVLEELPEVINGFSYKGTRYNCFFYPTDGLLLELVEKIQKRELFPEFHNKISIKNNVFVELKDAKLETGSKDNIIMGKKERTERKDLKTEKKLSVITYFVHGTTTDNERGLSTGQAQGELSELGIKQSKELIKKINKKFDIVFCSDLKRAIDSAEITFKKNKIIQDKRLRECNYGDLNQSPEENVKYLEHIDKPFPNGESLKDVEKRIKDFLHFLKNNYSWRSIAIVAHKAPQLALEVILKGKTWKQAIEEDWRNKKEWRPGWDYVLQDNKILKDNKDNIIMGKKESNIKENDFLSFVQEAGFIWGPEPEIYGGLAGFYTYGPIGKLLKNKVENSVRDVFNSNGFRELEGPTVLPDSVWKASGHLDTFTDPVILTKDGNESYRADKLLEENGVKIESVEKNYLLDLIKKHGIKAPDGKELGNKIENYSLMMKTSVAGTDASLRPETATVTYLPFIRMFNYFRKKLPFAVFQIGKAYRNEISPRQSVLRGREFTQAEGQIFIDPLEKNNWKKFDEIKDEKLPFWSSKNQGDDKGVEEMGVENALKNGFVKSQAYAWCLWLAYRQFISFGIPAERIRLRQHHEDEKAFYADDAWDVEIRLNNYNWVEVCGVHDRTDYDLKQHSNASGVKLEAIRENGEKFVPHILEIAFGTDRPTYALIDLFYEKKSEEEGKTMLKIPYHIAPVDVSIFPLMKKEELVNVALDIKEKLEKDFVVDYDVSGSIGRRYLRSAMVGTPFAITIDYDSLEKGDVTVRDRDSERQIRVKIAELNEKLKNLLRGEDRI